MNGNSFKHLQGKLGKDPKKAKQEAKLAEEEKRKKLTSQAKELLLLKEKQDDDGGGDDGHIELKFEYTDDPEIAKRQQKKYAEELETEKELEKEKTEEEEKLAEKEQTEEKLTEKKKRERRTYTDQEEKEEQAAESDEKETSEKQHEDIEKAAATGESKTASRIKDVSIGGITATQAGAFGSDATAIEGTLLKRNWHGSAFESTNTSTEFKETKTNFHGPTKLSAREGITENQGRTGTLFSQTQQQKTTTKVRLSNAGAFQQQKTSIKTNPNSENIRATWGKNR